MNFQFYWPIFLIVLSNIFYHICSRSTPNEIHPLASLSITYLIGAVVSVCLYAFLSRGGNLLAEYQYLNWSSFLLGITIVGLETGAIYMYKVGWPISSGQLVYSTLLTVCLLFVGRLLYQEAITAPKLIGILLCMAGLYLIRR